MYYTQIWVVHLALKWLLTGQQKSREVPGKTTKNIEKLTKNNVFLRFHCFVFVFRWLSLLRRALNKNKTKNNAVWGENKLFSTRRLPTRGLVPTDLCFPKLFVKENRRPSGSSLGPIGHRHSVDISSLGGEISFGINTKFHIK